MVSDIEDCLNKSSITVDVEDGINILMKDHFNIDIPPTDRVVKNVDRLLDLFAKHSTHSTFFVLGEVAELYPGLIRRIDASGHELGIHGFNHDQLFKQTSDRLTADLKKAKNLIEDIIGKPVHGYRAPAFSLIPQTAWALKIIAEVGFKYDSSIMPAQMRRYGWKGFPEDILKLELGDGFSIFEVPMPVISLMGLTIPACGGGYLRHFPLFVTDMAFKYILKERPVIVYLHPYELDTTKYPDYFYSAKKNAGLTKSLSLLFYRINKGTVFGKLDYLLAKYQFIPLAEIIMKQKNTNGIKTIRIDEIPHY